jgi:hypothetical protein
MQRWFGMLDRDEHERKEAVYFAPDRRGFITARPARIDIDIPPGFPSTRAALLVSGERVVGAWRAG